MRTIRIGMLGAGAISAHHIEAINAHPNAEVIAIADKSRPRTKALAARFGIAKRYTQMEDLIANPDVDAVSIALPNALHSPASLAALKTGKHVLLDKPFAMNIKEATKIAETARAARRKFCVGMNQRFTPDAQMIKTLVERGELGEVYRAKAYWVRRSGIPKFGTWFSQKKLAGGGSLLDIGVHMLDLSLYLLGNFRPVSVSGNVWTQFGNRGLGEGSWGHSDAGKRIFDVDDSASAFIRLRGGAVVQLEIAWAQHQAQDDDNGVQLFGTEGGTISNPATLYRNGARDGGYETVQLKGVPIKLPHCCRHRNWIDAILGQAKLECTVQQALAVQKTIDAIYQSAKTGKEVRIK